MRPKIQQIFINDLTVEVVRKKIKHMHLSVRTPDGQVRVSAPLHVDDDTVRRMVIIRLEWIKRQQARLAAQERPPNYAYLSGERHLFQGREYVLEVSYREGPPGMELYDSQLRMRVRPGSDENRRRAVLMSWYRQQLYDALPALTSRWEAIIGVKAAEWRIRQMKTRWGSCNVQKRHIWLNLELAKRPTECLEYIIVHELVHLLENGHNKRFKALMDRFMPDWRQRCDELSEQQMG